VRPAHQDPRDGRQYHVRYWSESAQTWYWMHVSDDLDDAEQTRQSIVNSGRRTQMFVRDVSPWREL
jgi:hypothetical protein